MKKCDLLHHWRGLPENMDPMPHFEPVPYKSTGSTYGACGVRIDGTPEFIDAVLSRLKPLLQGECADTRLALTRRPASSDFKATPNSVDRGEVCYIRLHERGHEAKIARKVYPKMFT